MKVEEDALANTQNLMQITITKENVIAEIAKKVFEMLTHDFPALVNLLYKIDVNENKAKECFGKENSEIAKCLAELIWARQMYKAELRKKYS